MAAFSNNSQVPEIAINPNLRNNESISQPQPSITQYPPGNNVQLPRSNQKPAALPEPDLPQGTPMQIGPQFPSMQQQPIQQSITASPQPSLTPRPLGQTPPVTPELHYERGTTMMGEQPFFVRIDKFKETRENFEEIHVKIHEMEQILENLEYTKEQEDRELEEWKNDINEMKSLLSDIDKEIFSKI